MELEELDARNTLRLSLLGDLDDLPWSQRVVKSLHRHYFSIACVAAIAVAAIYPPAGRTGGPLKPELTAELLAVMLIFFFTGLTLRTKTIQSALRRWKINLYAQLINLGVFPVFVFLVSLALARSSFDSRLLDGTVILACIPTSVSMSVVMTKAAGGNEAVAVCNASGGNILGVFLTPAWVLGLANATTSVPFGTTMVKLIYKVST